MSIKAKFPGKCPNCNTRFIVGKDDIENVKGKWVHVICPPYGFDMINPSQEAPGQRYVGKSYTTSNLTGRNVPTSVEEESKASVNFAAALEAIEAPVEIVAEEKVFTPSVYQKAIYEYIESMVAGTSEKKHLVVEAVAGSGKTTTIVKALKLLPEDLNVAFVAYNVHIANQLKKRAPAYVHVSTTHSLGLQIIRENVGKVTIDSKGTKVDEILNALYPVYKHLVEQGKLTKEERKENYKKRSGLRSLISMAKAALVDTENKQAVLDMIEYYAIEIDEKYQDELVKVLPSVMEKCKNNTQLVDFDDMIWLPVVLNMNAEGFDFLMGDEWQDMNTAQIELLLKCVGSNGHLIAVGDRKQSLYGFRGADIFAIPRTIERLDAEVLPLSVTYRCPTSHVDLAKEIVPQIEAKEEAPLGEVIEMKYRNLVQELQDGDMVICRTNAPLVAPAFACIRAGKKAIIRGKDSIGNSMISLVKRFEAETLSELAINLSEYYEAEFQRLVDHGKEMQALYLTDKVETLRFIMGESNSVAGLLNNISSLFSEENTGVIFSSVHKAKGLEAERVFILKPELMPHPKAKEPWQAEQEMNAKYVALTRSKDKLYFVIGGGEDI